jgi:hypothetical protein
MRRDEIVAARESIRGSKQLTLCDCMERCFKSRLRGIVECVLEVSEAQTEETEDVMDFLSDFRRGKW